MRVRSVRIENFKQFASLRADFGELDCLVGANNSGKTTLLQALALFDFCAHHCLAKKNGNGSKDGGEERQSHLELTNRTVAPEDFYVLPVTNPMDLWTNRKAMEGGKQRRIKVEVTLSDNTVVTATVKLDFNRFGISIETSDESQEALLRLVQLKIAYLPVFSMFHPREERRMKPAIMDELARGRVNSVIRNLLLDLKDDGKLADLVGVLQRGFPALRDLEVEFDDVTDRYINVSYKELDRPKQFDIFSAGSGFQQFLYLFGFIIRYRPTVIMLDEPDVHLHGTLQAVLLEELKRIVTDGKQVMFATHSRELITRAGPENVLSLEPEEDGELREARRLRVAFDVFDTIDRLGSLDPTQLSSIQAYRRIIVVEDQSDRDLLSVFCSKSLGADLWSRIERRVAFCYSKGSAVRQHDMSRLKSLLQQLISLSGSPLQLFVVADRDYYPDVDELRRSLPDDVEWHVWNRNEIENYLLDINAIQRLVTVRDGDRTFDSLLLVQEFNRLIEASRSRADDGLVQAFDDLRRASSKPWNAATMSRMAREYLDSHWEIDKLSLADAKEIVLPGIKRWLQDNGFGQFSDRRLAESMARDEFPEEVHSLAIRLARFAGVEPMSIA
ncbi:MAG: AAA family ATPase [Planctomycetes bacterium]|nr:AAA family ATPase [Planctomycetota bacterium]